MALRCLAPLSVATLRAPTASADAGTLDTALDRLHADVFVRRGPAPT